MREQAGAGNTNIVAGGVDEVFTRTDSTGTASPVADRLGSVVSLTDSAGTIQTQYSYEPFGKTSASGANSANTSQYTGRESDGTGLYYYRARYYSPSLQRFIREDPIGFLGGDINLYAYVFNSPTNFTDPSGHGLDLFIDLGFIGYDLYQLATGGRKDLEENLTALALDVVGALIPVVTGLGAISRAGRAAKSGGGLRGGAYCKLAALPGLERHHMPANSISPLKRGRGPAIQMEKADHALTSSFGSSGAAQAYRQEIEALLNQGRWRDAMAGEIRDVRNIGGSKYNQAIQEMLKYARQQELLKKP